VTPRLNPFAAAPVQMQSWLEFGKGTLKCGLEDSLMPLVTIRTSEINGSAVSLDTHTAVARKQGETERRLFLLDAWRVSSLCSERERAALGWTQGLTRLSETHAPDDAYQALQSEFSPEEQVKLTLSIVTINGWNRVELGFRAARPVATAKVA
jgi:AhpD family alkylhydroperoxidase